MSSFRPEAKNAFRIIAGERRYRALKLLEERGDISADYGVRVELRKGLNKHETLRLATVENLQREDLPPLDQATALAALIRKGTTLEDLVAQTGISAGTIRRRLALNSLCEEARTALAGGKLTLSRAEALTLGSAEAQRNVLEHLAEGHEYSADEIKDHFLDGRPTVAMAVFPVERYTGTITTDLFREEEASYFDDVEQFFALQQEAVADLVKRYEGTALWVEVTEDYSLRDWQYEKAEEGQSSGVLINLSPAGHVEIREGLLRPDIDPDTAEATADSPATGASARRPIQRPFAAPSIRERPESLPPFSRSPTCCRITACGNSPNCPTRRCPMRPSTHRPVFSPSVSVLSRRRANRHGNPQPRQSRR